MRTDIPTTYDPSTIEGRWYAHWLEAGHFHSEPDDREPYCVVIPPPNVTGVLHMGHMLNNTIQDVLVRRARMQGKNACWVPGTDHASIATEAKVVRRLREQGIRKADLSREQFLEHAWEWTREHGGIILEQLKKLGGEDIVVVCGGVIPAQDYDFLREAGAAAIFGPGTNIPQAASEVLALVRRRGE